MIIRRTSPPRSSPPCEVLRPASPCDLPELESHTSTTTLQEITIRPAPELKFESDTTTGTTTIVDSTNSSNSSEGSTTFQPAKKQKVAHNPSEDVVAVLGFTTTTTSNNEESYVCKFKYIRDML